MAQSIKWTADHREELLLFVDLLNKLGYLNKGSRFIENAERCIEISELLTRDDILTGRQSFCGFLFDLAAADLAAADNEGYSPDAVREMLELERERCARLCENADPAIGISGTQNDVLMRVAKQIRNIG